MMCRFGLRLRRTAAAALLSGIIGFSACSSDDNPVDPDNTDPVAQFTTNPLIVPSGDNHQTVVTLDASGSFDSDGDALTYSWSAMSAQFVEGTTSSSRIAKITFPGTAPYEVILTVRDGRGGQDTETITIELGP